jgi:hypothetical protein
VRLFFGKFISFLFGENVSRSFWIWPVIKQGRVRFCLFGATGECTKHAYAPSPPAHNAFSSYKLGPKEELLGVLQWQPYDVHLKYF